MSQTHPVILISGASAHSASVQAMTTRILATGGEPVVIDDHLGHLAGKDEAGIRAQVQADLARADAVIVLGNSRDIDPARYGQLRHEHTVVETETPEGRARAAYEYALIEETLAAKKPYLGVCGGMQRLNVLLGGSLHQHVPDLVGNEMHNQKTHDTPPFIPVEFVQVTEGTTLASIGEGAPGVYVPAHGVLPSNVTMQNSMHHQAVDKVGEGLRVSAASLEADRPEVHIVEAVEADPNGRFGQQFIMGVQWHPEFGDSVLSHQVINRLTAEAREYAKGHERVLTHESHDRPHSRQWVTHVLGRQKAAREAAHAKGGSWSIP